MSKPDTRPTATKSAPDALSNVSSSTTRTPLSPKHPKPRIIRAPSVSQVAKKNLSAEPNEHNTSASTPTRSSRAKTHTDPTTYDTLITLNNENVPPQRTSQVDSRFRTHNPNVEDGSFQNRPDILAQRQLEKHLLNTLLDAEHEAKILKHVLSQSRANEAFLSSRLAQSQQYTLYLEAQLGAAHAALSAYEQASVTSPDYLYAVCGDCYPPSSLPENAEDDVDTLSPVDSAYAIPRSHSFGDLHMYTSNDW